MLIAVQEYLSCQGVCSLTEISQHFNTSPDAMRGMLAHWIRKGKLMKEVSGCQKGCLSCSPEHLEIYRWQGSGRHIPVCNL
ncbi:FeoC-like transcriptional regulator [Candidatus Sororendozoicomonas aggregata]|uniref:FeoC-like transcriptional regulator n=1 Tax=Candidatus Sororendozoicomonas aggregata TaxID=3073239 RepID=UPI002ED45C83